MSTNSQVIEVLKNHGFTSSNSVEARASSLMEAGRARVLEDISTLYGRNHNHLMESCRAADDEIALLPEVHNSDKLDVANLTRLCFYADHVIVPNPLISINPEINNAIRMDLDATQGGINQEQLFVDAVQSILDVEPLVSAGYVKLYPREIWTDTRLHLHLRDYSRDILNDPLRGYARKHVGVKTGSVGKNLEVITELEAQERPSRVVTLEFDDKSSNTFHFYSEPAMTNFHKQQDGSVKFEGVLMDTGTLNAPIDIESYKAWRNGIVQEVVLNRAELCFEHLSYSQNFNSSFVANHQSSWDILRLAFSNKAISKPTRPKDSKVAAALVELNLPYLALLAPKDLASLRKNSDEFENFRRALRDFERDLRFQPGTREFKAEVRQLQKDRIETPIANLTKEQRRIKEKFFADAFLAFGSLIAAAYTGQLAWAVGALASFPPLVTLSREKEKMGENSVYFLWQAQRRFQHKTGKK